jgi:hypothetical protein
MEEGSSTNGEEGTMDDSVLDHTITDDSGDEDDRLS